MIRRELFNVVVEVRPDTTGRTYQIPAVADEFNQVMMPLVRYLGYLREKGASQAKLSQIREAAKLFAEYAQATFPSTGFGERKTGPVQTVSHWKLFKSFRAAIVCGTFGNDGSDPSGLCWQSSGPSKANRVIKQLTEFMKYLDELDGGDRAERFNPQVSGTAYERLWQASNYEYQRSKALLGHAWATAGEMQAEVRALNSNNNKSSTASAPKRIQDFQFNQLFDRGFDLTTDNGIRDALVAILMNKGGLRLSEALHAWVIDFLEDPVEPDMAFVKLIHPSQGPCNLTYRNRKFGTRSEYLSVVYGLPDRTELPEKHAQHLGWKSKFSVLRVYWIPPWWGRIFFRLWREYLARTATKRATGPYAFIMESGCQWVPLTTDAYRKSYQRAIYASGLVHDEKTDMKNSGLTSHANRHAYGDRAKNKLNLGTKEVMKLLNHASPDSQEVYTNKTDAEVMDEIKRRCDEMKHDRSFLPNGVRHASGFAKDQSDFDATATKIGLWAIPDAVRPYLMNDEI